MYTTQKNLFVFTSIDTQYCESHDVVNLVILLKTDWTSSFLELFVLKLKKCWYFSETSNVARRKLVF